MSNKSLEINIYRIKATTKGPVIFGSAVNHDNYYFFLNADSINDFKNSEVGRRIAKSSINGFEKLSTIKLKGPYYTFQLEQAGYTFADKKAVRLPDVITNARTCKTHPAYCSPENEQASIELIREINHNASKYDAPVWQ